MAGFRIPVFEKGSVLTQDMLETMKEYAIDFANMQFDGYSDGIISGCGVSMSNNLLMVDRGIVKYKNTLYFIPGGMHVTVQSGNQWNTLNLRLGALCKVKNFLTGSVELELSEDLQECENRIEICRFRLQDGAMLRNNYRDFQDMSTEFDTVNVIHAKWSAYGLSSVSNRILKEFAKEAMNKNMQNPLDQMFVQQILMLDGRTMNRDAITFYLNTRLGRNNRPMTNMEIYKGLQEVLRTCQQAGNGFQRGPLMPPRGERRIIVD